MKTKRIILALTLSLFMINTKAQVKFGIKEGLTFSTQSELGMLWDNNDMKVGFSLGITSDYRFHETLSLQTEVNYKREGLAYETSETTGKVNVNRNYDYYNIPVLLKGRFNDQLGLSEKWFVSFYGGPYFSYLRSARNEVESNGLTTSQSYKNESNDSDWGFVFGGEVARVLNSGELFLDLRYEMGLTDVTTTNEDIQNKVIGLSLGYRF